MIRFDTARALTLKHVNIGVSDDLTGQIVIRDEDTIEKDYGWIFFYQTGEFVRTGDLRYGIICNGPIVVLKADGTIHELPSNDAPEKLIFDYELRRRVNENESC